MPIIPKFQLTTTGVHDGHTEMSWTYQFIASADDSIFDSGTRVIRLPGVGLPILLKAYTIFMQWFLSRLNDAETYQSAAYQRLDELQGWAMQHQAGLTWVFSHPALCPDGFTAQVVMDGGYPTLQSLVLALDEAPPPPDP